MNILFKQGLQNFIAVVAVLFVSHSNSIADELQIHSEASHKLLEKTAALEAEIQHRQQTATIETEKSKEYKSGYTDGYNKAVLDLVKAKLLNDSSLIPKQKISNEAPPQQQPLPVRSHPQRMFHFPRRPAALPQIHR